MPLLYHECHSSSRKIDPKIDSMRNSAPVERPQEWIRKDFASATLEVLSEHDPVGRHHIIPMHWRVLTNYFDWRRQLVCDLSGLDRDIAVTI